MSDPPPLHKISISGPTFSSLIQRFSSSPGPIDGLLFGHVSLLSPSTLSDDPPTDNDDNATLVATITSFLPSPSPSPLSPSASLPHPHPSPIGWFSARRKSPLRPSMREFSVSSSLSLNAPSSAVFLLLASPIPDQFIHTHEYRAYEFRRDKHSFQPRSLDIVNIGPAFRAHYGNFTPNSPFPFLACDFRGSSAMSEDKDERALYHMKRVCEDQKKVDVCVEGFDVGRLNRLVGEEAMSYTSGVEDLYEKMLFKIETLARQVEITSAKVLEQENHNRKLRYKILKSPVPE